MILYLNDQQPVAASLSQASPRAPHVLDLYAGIEAIQARLKQHRCPAMRRSTRRQAKQFTGGVHIVAIMV